MGDTIWVLIEGQESDDWDHSVLLREQKGLDRLAEILSVAKLSELFDFSAYAEEVEDCLTKVGEAEAANCRVRLAIIP